MSYLVEVQWGKGASYNIGRAKSKAAAGDIRDVEYKRRRSGLSTRGAMPTIRIWKLVEEVTLPREKSKR